MRARLDQLGKNVLRDLLVIVGNAETETEVPAGDAQKIDLWYVPEPARLRSHPELLPGLLGEMAAEPAMVELFSGALDAPAFHACVRKRYQWHHVLETRDKRRWPLPVLWVVSAGRPDGVLADFGFGRAKQGPAGHYVTEAPGWRIHLVVVAELPTTRETILLRLMGSPRVRVQAIRELVALPPDAWERSVALPWLVRLSFEVPADLSGLPAEEEALIMETREWFEQFKRQLKDEGRLSAVAPVVEKRLGRQLDEAERATLAERLKRVREDHLGNILIQSSAEAFAAWLADPDAPEPGMETRELSEQLQQKAEERGRLSAVTRVVEKRLGRALDDAERVTLAERLHRLGEDRIIDLVIQVSSDAFAAWLADPSAT